MTFIGLTIIVNINSILSFLTLFLFQCSHCFYYCLIAVRTFVEAFSKLYQPSIPHRGSMYRHRSLVVYF